MSAYMPMEQDLKLTDLDYMSGDHHLQMMKAALPYMSVSEQKAVSLFVKMRELTKTRQLFNDEQVSMMGIGSSGGEPRTPANMLSAIKPYANPREQDFIEIVSNVMRSAGKPPMEQMKAMLTPDQQNRLETMQLMMQMMQQTT